jgi:hypothetical protein
MVAILKFVRTVSAPFFLDGLNSKLSLARKIVLDKKVISLSTILSLEKVVFLSHRLILLKTWLKLST